MQPEFLALAIPTFIFSIILHEVMHGWVALKFGDTTALRAGRLTLNPLPHIDPVGSILLPFFFLILPYITGHSSNFFIAWAKPVPTNPLNFSDLKKGELFVSAAGIIANFGLVIIATILFHVLLPTLGINHTLTQLLSFTVTINLILGLFNLLPIPPLDGSHILLSLLPYKLAREYEKIMPYGLLILLILLWSTPIISIFMGTLIGIINSVLNMPLRLF